MGRNKGDKPLTPKQREQIKYIVAPRLKYRDTSEQILERLEDAGHTISLTTLTIIKKEMRQNIGDRFKEIAEVELAEEHDLAIQTMKILLKKMLDYAEGDILDKDGSINTDAMVRISGEIRNINRDLVDYYGSTDMVDSVFKYFKHEKEEAELLKIKATEKKVGDITPKQKSKKSRKKDSDDITVMN